MRAQSSVALSLLVTALLAAAGPCVASDLPDFLDKAERMATASGKIEADVVVKDARGNTRNVHVAIDPAGEGKLTFEAPDIGWKSETPLAWKDGTGVRKTGAAAGPIGVDEPLGDTDLRGIDFFPWWKTDYSRAMQADETPLERTVTLYADKGRPYSLYVIGFEKERFVTRMVKYYRDNFSNLVRIRTDKDWVMVGARPQPGAILVKDFGTGSMRTYTFAWKQAGSGK